MKKRIYISGQLTGLPPDEVKKNFYLAKEWIEYWGHIPIFPLEKGLPPDAKWTDYLIADIAVLFDCDAIYMLSNWVNSKGAHIQKYIAQTINLDIIDAENEEEYFKQKVG